MLYVFLDFFRGLTKESIFTYIIGRKWDLNSYRSRLKPPCQPPGHKALIQRVPLIGLCCGVAIAHYHLLKAIEVWLPHTPWIQPQGGPKPISKDICNWVAVSMTPMPTIQHSWCRKLVLESSVGSNKAKLTIHQTRQHTTSLSTRPKSI